MIDGRVSRRGKRDGSSHNAFGLESRIDRECCQQAAAEQRYGHDQNERQRDHRGDEGATQPAFAPCRGWAATQDLDDVSPRGSNRRDDTTHTRTRGRQQGQRRDHTPARRDFANAEPSELLERETSGFRRQPEGEQDADRRSSGNDADRFQHELTRDLEATSAEGAPHSELARAIDGPHDQETSDVDEGDQHRQCGRGGQQTERSCRTPDDGRRDRCEGHARRWRRRLADLVECCGQRIR